MAGNEFGKGILRLAVVLSAVILSGCHIGKEFPVYPMETREDNSEFLSIDGVGYRRDWDGNELAEYYNGGDVWTLADGLGEQIGVCGYKAESGGGLAIYEAAGDEERAVLYTVPRKFYFGGRDVRLWLREDVSLGPPQADMVSCITVSWGEENDAKADVQVQIEDPVLVKDLLESYHSSSDQAVSHPSMGGQWIGCTLTLHHKDYPFFQYEIHGGYSPEQNKAYCQNDALEWFVLSEEWAEVLGKQISEFH